ncbi:MAG: hydroxymethylglutaryl-CoA lyase [Gammaproteobacteria bacterium]|nr:hydroxymethylglutaryl-CoA lyase [Gammaproteobacteria bacterium]MBU1444076.1 hydroxymethylglutaryl-CoA lyase [Gammaproteobacteria bacterium]MBU2409608.1 hydroxymethylglutaryl-CoA lyase [Gammaproteobacteria bacterium]
MLNLPERITLCEVGPRDGLQSLDRWIETDTKIAMTDRLSQAGFPVIEVTGFARNSVIPNLRDAEEVCARIQRRPGTVYRALVPNARGAERALESKLDELLGLITVSETYLRKNQNMSLPEAIEQGIRCFRLADDAGVDFVMAVGVAMWCAYEGTIPEEKTLDVLRQLHDGGIRRFYLAGSMGMEDPAQVGSIFRRIARELPDCEVGYHVHNLAGRATANVLAAVDAGASSIEGSICGIGGGIAMPTSVASVGNLPTEDLVCMFEAMGVRTGVDPEEAVAAARDVAALLGIEPRSHAAQVGTRAELLEQGRHHPRNPQTA